MKRIAIMLLAVTMACESDDPTSEKSASDYIVFGRYYGMCSGDRCVQFYKLTDASIYEDTKDKYPMSSQAYEGDYVLLDNSQFEKVKTLRDEIPDELFDITETVIGEPDAGDWGGLYFEMEHHGKRQFWFIDLMKSNVPENLRPFVDTINGKVELLND
ncbi:hypothetical protein WBG78_16205 [Chryseolinea sp. T2]|uniref:hypothetical protein n=1 Tax=Chryseolinea sp. T2 TaxID=3129255 RepID=UPI00307761F4